MKKYEITANYTCCKYIGEVEAENQEQAIEIAYQKGMIDSSISLCWECSKEADELLLDDESVIATETE